jgi:hypothetical protein
MKHSPDNLDSSLDHYRVILRQVPRDDAAADARFVRRLLARLIARRLYSTAQARTAKSAIPCSGMSICAHKDEP